MVKVMEVHLPDEIADHEGELRYFVDTMVRKLHMNRHKGFIEGVTPAALILRCMDELKELQAEMDNGNQFTTFVEAADVANFAFLTGLAALRMTRQDFNTYQRNEANK